MIGFVRIAFTHAFHHLAHGSTYAQALRATLRIGGDTDTNACIVGGLVGAVTGVLWIWLSRFWLPLLGWWSHVLIDVFTHSADFYPSPVFYPVTYWGFDGVAWNTPWFMIINYLVMLSVAIVILHRK